MLDTARLVLARHEPRRLADPTTVPAAVLILLYEKEGEAHVLLTERTHDVEHHKGQVSFPGGASDAADDDLRITALRETFEEVGVPPEEVEIIGQLDDLVTISNFNVTPFVGVLRNSSCAFEPFEQEVAAVLEVPLRHLRDDSNMELELLQRRGRPVLVPAFSWGPYRIWGATARIVKQLLDLISTS
ncbi:MAG: CoA pyrophosphatase [Chloroflexi bacterium]|nr:CoA pyrophosphatase [Chloroflexota bacterium]